MYVRVLLISIVLNQPPPSPLPPPPSPLPPSLQSLRPEVMRLRSAVDKASSNRDKYVDKFCFCLDRDITELAKEVKEVKNQAQVYTCRCSGVWA